jgi:hypothetical protein
MTKLTLGYDSYLFSYKIGYQVQTKYLIQLRFMHNCVILYINSLRPSVRPSLTELGFQARAGHRRSE